MLLSRISRSCRSWNQTTKHAYVPLLAVALLAEGAVAYLAPATAQEAPRVVGIATDEQTGGAIEGATIQLFRLSVAFRRTVTDEAGTFTFNEVAPGDYILITQRLGYEGLRTPIRIASSRRAPLTVHLKLIPKAVVLDPIDVTVRARPPRLVDSGFYRRMEENWGTFFEPDWIEANTVGYTSLATFLSTLQRRAGESQCRQVPVYLDRRYVGATTAQRRRNSSSRSTLLSELSVSEIGAAEYYPPQSPLPRFAWTGQTMICGAIILWSQWTTQVADVDVEIPAIDVSLCEPARRLGEGVIEGVVVDEITDVRLPAARVLASYTMAYDAGHYEIEARTDTLGRFRLCDLPLAARVQLTAFYGDYHSMHGNEVIPRIHAASENTVRLAVPVTKRR